MGDENGRLRHRPVLVGDDESGVRTTTPTIRRLVWDGCCAILPVLLRAHATPNTLENIIAIFVFFSGVSTVIKSRKRCLDFWSNIV